MKRILQQAIIFSLIFSFTGCKKNDNTKPTEVRFVDLQGKPKPIKTRIPEANAKIMSGQISHKDSLDANLQAPNADKSSDKSLESYKKNFGNFNTSNKVGIIEQDKNSSQEVVEYDLSQENNANKISKNIDKEFVDNETSQENFVNNNPRKNTNKSEIYEEETTESSPSEITSNNNKNIYNNNISETSDDQNDNKIITYSSKKYKKTANNRKQKFDQNAQDVEFDQSDKYSNNTTVKTSKKSSTITKYSIGDKGKYYVQVGAFNNSSGARERLNLIKGYKNGKVLIANIDSRRIYRSVFGPYSTKNQAMKVKNSIENSGNEAIIIRNK